MNPNPNILLPQFYFDYLIMHAGNCQMWVRPNDNSLAIAAVNLITKQNNVVRAKRKKEEECWSHSVAARHGGLISGLFSDTSMIVNIRPQWH